jgi:hypothetical protein
MATSSTQSFVPRVNADGSANPNYVDLLEEDKPLAGQKYVCLSFISPEKIIKQRELFNFQQFLKQWELNVSLEKYNHFLSFLAYKYSLNFEKLSTDLQEFCKEEKDKLFETLSMEDRYKNFLDNNEQQLEVDFNKEHGFQTSTRGVKVRGVFPSQEEAEMRCKLLRQVDPNHDVYVGQVGLWMPFHPEAYRTGRVEYLEDELNQLMMEKTQNEQKAKIEFDKRVRETKQKAIAENMEKAKASGNKLTQTLNAEGNLVNVKDTMGFSENTPLEDVRKGLFEGDNIVTATENNDKGLARLAQVRELPEDPTSVLPADKPDAE